MIKILKSSINELKSVRCLTVSAMLIALNCVLRLLVIPITQTVNVTLFFLPISIGGMLFGPIVGGIIGAVGDVISYSLNPTGPYFFGFTLNYFIFGLVYGFFFYKKKPKILPIIFARLTLTVFIDFGLTPLWLHLLYSSPLLPIYAERLIKCAILFPIEILLLYIITNAVYKIIPKFLQ